MTLSPSRKIRNQHRLDVGHDPYANPRRDTVDPTPRVQRRSLSPRAKVEGSRRVLLGEGRSGMPERRDYGWHLGAGRSEKVRSGSPPFVQELKKPHFDGGVVHRKYEYFEDMDYDDGKSNRLKQVYGYDHHGASSRISKDKDYSDGRGMMGQKLVPVDDGITRGSYRVPPELVPTSNYGENVGHIPLTSRSMDISRSEHEKLRYREPISSDKIPVRELYNEARDASYTMASSSHPKDFGSSSQFKDSAGTSSGVSRREFPSTYREGVPLSAPDEYPRSSVKLTEPLDFDTYGQRSAVGIRDHEASKRIMTSYPEGAYSPKRNEHDNYIYTKSQGIVNDDNVYPTDNLHRMMSPRPRLDYEHARADYEHLEHARTDYDHVRTDYELRELSRPSIIHPVVNKTNQTEDCYGNLRKSTVWGHPTIQKQAAAVNLDTGRILYASKHDGEYLGSGYTQVEFERRELRDNELSHSGVIEDHQISHFRSDYGFGRDAGPQFPNERLQDPPISIYDLEMQQLPVQGQRMKEELAIYEASDKMLKRKYIVEDGINRYDTRTIVSSKWNASQEFEEQYDSGDEWIDEDTSALHASRTRRFDSNVYRKTKRTYDGRDHPADFTSEDWLSSQDSLALGRRHTVRNYKPGVKYIKGHPKSGSLNWYNTHQTDRRSGIHRQHKVWKRNDDYDEDAHENVDDPSEDWVNPADSELAEDSEEFKQLVDDAFLMYSKRLNLNSAVRRRYREQGKAGSLFCIVCGRRSVFFPVTCILKVEHIFIF